MVSLRKCENVITFFAERNDAFKMLKQSMPMVEEAITILQTAQTVTKLVQKTDCTLSDFYGACIVMEEKLKKMTSKSNKQTDLAKCLLDSFISRKNLFKNEAIISAVCLDRRFADALSEDKTEFGKKALYRLYKRVCESIEAEKNDSNDASKNDSDFDFEKFFVEKGCQPVVEDDTQVEESIVFNKQMNETGFLIMFGEFENKIKRLHHTVDIIPFWKEQKNNFPELYALSTILNSVPPAQAAVERCFSALSFVYNCRRCKLSMEHLEDILLIRLNKEMVNDIFNNDMKALEVEEVMVEVDSDKNGSEDAGEDNTVNIN